MGYVGLFYFEEDSILFISEKQKKCSMTDELDRANPLFEGRVPFRVLRASQRGSHSGAAGAVDPTRPSRNEGGRPATLTVRVLSGTRLVDGLRQSLLHTELADDANPFFLYTLDVTENDYRALKAEQSLVVDFSSFSPHFIDLIKACVPVHLAQQDANVRVESSGAEDPKIRMGLLTTERSPLVPSPDCFEAVLDTGASGGSQATLSIVESNHFKHLTHLALRFQPGTDQTIKAYLAGRLQLTEDRLERSETACANLSEQLAAQESETASVRAKLAVKTSELVTIKKDMDIERKSQLSVQREEFATAMESSRATSESEIRRLREKCESVRSSMEERVQGLAEANAELQDARRRLESERDDLTSQVAALRTTASEARSEAQELRERARDIERSKFESEKMANQFQLQIAALKQHVEDKENTLQSTSALHLQAQDRLGNVTETLQLYKESAAKLQKKFDLSVAEIKKGNSVIQRLHTDLKQTKSKLKLKTTVIKQQEALIEEHKKQMDDVQRGKDATARELAAARENVAALERTVEESRSKLIECHKMLESNQNVITNLNKEINEAQMGIKVPLGSSAYTFRPAVDDLPPSYSPTSSPLMDGISPFEYGAADIGSAPGSVVDVHITS